MNRKIKNILMILLIALLGVGMYFTINEANTNSASTSQNSVQNLGAPPDMNNQGSSDSQSTPPEKPDSDNNSTNNTSDNSSNNSSQTTPPTKPDGDSNSTDNTSTNNSTTSETTLNDNQMTPPDMSTTSTESSISVFFYILFIVESLIESILIIYLIMSKFNKKTFKETLENKDKKLIYLLATILLTGILTFFQTYLTNNLKTNNSQTTIESSNEVEASGNLTIDGEDKTLTDTYESSTADESPIVVKNGGNLTLKNAKVNKKSGDTTNTENSEFYGINSGVLVQKDSTAKITNTTINTSAKGSNAVFSTGENSKIYISDSTITTTGSSSSRGLDATYGGYIKADNVTITTKGGSCAALATDRGEGTVIANNSNLETNGQGSPVIYSTGDISIEDTKGTANGSQMVVIEGKNSATVTNSTLNASGKGNRNEVDNAGIMIYQSMSGDASEGKGTFTSKDSTLAIQKDSDYYKTTPMFFITNTEAEINLENTKLSYGSNTLLSIKGTDEWGTTNSNGGNVTLNATNQTLTGNIELDKISTLELNLTKSTYKGTINTNNTAKEINLTLDKNSKITLTGDSYVTSLGDKDTSYSNINFNGYKLYVNGKAIN